MADPNRIPAPRLWLVLNRCQRALAAHVEQSIADSGLCLSDFMALEALLHKGPLTIGEIREKVLLASGSMTAAVDRLERHGLVAREFTKSDRRARLVRLTPKGSALMQPLFRRHAKDLEGVAEVLSREEVRIFYGLARKLGLFAAEMLNTRAEGTKA